MANAPTVKEATDTTPGSAVIYGAPDIVHIVELLKGTHATEALQTAAIDTLDTQLAAKLAIAATSLVGSGFFLDDDTMAANDDTKTVSQQSLVAYVAAEIATALTSDITLQGNYDAATNTPDLDTTPSGITKGDHYVVSVAGVFFAANVEAGDSLIAKIDNPTLETDWIITQANLDAASIKTLYESNADTNALTDTEKTAVGNLSGTNSGDEPAASDTVPGIIEIATGAEVTTGTDNVRAISPLALLAATDIVSNAMLSNMAANSFKGNNTGSAADPIDMTVAQAKTLLAIVAADISDLATVVKAYRLDEFAAPTSAVSLGSQNATNVRKVIRTLDAEDTALDFDDEDLASISIVANTTFTGSNYGTGKVKELRIITDGTLRTLAFPAGWVFVGAKPADQAASKTGLLKLTCYGAAEADVVAEYAVQT